MEFESSPLVAVWMITFNQEEYISQAVESVVTQRSNFPIKLYLSDDCSTDGTREICIDLKAKYRDKIELFLPDSNLGVRGENSIGMATYKRCIESQARYIALLEGDDYWTDPFKLQKQVDFLEKYPDCVLCHHWHKYAIRLDDGSYREVKAPTNGYLTNQIASVKDVFENRLRVKTRTLMFRNVIKTFPKWFSDVAFGDVPLSMILGKFGRFGFINEEMAVYRQTGTGISSKDSDKHDYFLNHYLEWIKIWEMGNDHFQDLYLDETVASIKGFYKRILKYYFYSPRILVSLLLRIGFKSNLPVIKRLIISIYLIGYFVKGKSSSLTRRLGGFGNGING